MKQKKQKEWFEQWELVQDDELFLFQDWIYPNTLDDFINKNVLECGCGGGQHTSFIAPYAKKVTSVDLNTIPIAKERNKKNKNVIFIEDDIATMNLKTNFDIVFSIGVVHHTDDPNKTVMNLKKYLKKNGKLILWVYSKEGNFLVKNIVEPFRKIFLTKMKKKNLLTLSKIITSLMYIPIFSVYFLPLSFLPYYQYFRNFRKLSFYRNTLNVFDKLNAPQVHFIDESQANSWLPNREFDNITITSYKNVSWRISGTKII